VIFPQPFSVSVPPRSTGLSAASLSPNSGSTLIFVDSGVLAAEQIFASSAPGSEIYYLDAQRDGLTQITEALRGRSGIDSLQILSHGQAGALQLGQDWFDASRLSRERETLAQWQTALSADADILLYGCNVGQGELGAAFVQILSQLTGADVAASEDLTGAASLGGDWDLEVRSGEVAQGLSAASYAFVLNTVAIGGTSIGTYTENGAPLRIAPTGTYTTTLLMGEAIASMQVSLTGALPSDRLFVVAGNNISLDGQRVLLNGTQVALAQGGLGDSLTLTFTSGPSPANADIVQAVLRQIAYSNAADNLTSGSRTVNVVVNKTAPGGNSASPTSSASLGITGVNDAPFAGRSTGIYTPTGTALPGSQGWLQYQFFGNGVTQTGSATGTTFNSTASNGSYAGYTNYASTPLPFIGVPVFTGNKVNANFPVLDRASGYVLSFNLQVQSETHTNTDANADGKGDLAGFSVTLLSEDLRGIELGFWTDRVFAQEDGTTQTTPGLQPEVSNTQDNHLTFFTQAEFASLNTTTATSYDLAVLGDSYTLFANGAIILTGRLRNYSAFTPPAVPGVNPDLLNPYRRPSFVFLGDNSASTSSNVVLGAIAVSTPQTLPNQTIAANGTTPVLPFKVLDVDGTAVSITPSSSNPALLPTTGIALGGSGTSRTLQLTPTSGAGGTATVNLNVSDGQATTSRSLTLTVTGGTPTGSSTSGPDFNADGNVDILWRNYQTGENQVWLMNQGQVLGAINLPTLSDTNWVMEGTGDFDRDGKVDIVWRNYRTGANVIWLMDGTTTRNGVDLLALTDVTWKIEGVGDFNQDGQLDIFWRNYTTGANEFWVMNGTAPQYGLPILGLPAQWVAEAVGDYDRDGQLDLVWRNYQTGENIIWLMNGTSPTFGANLVGLTPDWVLEGTADYDRDGQLDLVWRNYSSGQNVIWFMNGPAPRVGVDFLALNFPSWNIEDIR
jgi:hypothetical protein